MSSLNHIKIPIESPWNLRLRAKTLPFSASTGDRADASIDPLGPVRGHCGHEITPTKSTHEMGVSENRLNPIVPNGFADHYPYEKWLFHWEYTQHFQTNPNLATQGLVPKALWSCQCHVKWAKKVDHPISQFRACFLLIIPCLGLVWFGKPLVIKLGNGKWLAIKKICI